MKKNFIKYLISFTLLFVLTSCNFNSFSNSSQNTSSLGNLDLTGEFPTADTQINTSSIGNINDIIKSIFGKPQNPTPPAPPLDPTKMRGVWISFLEFDWALKGKSEEEFTANINKMFANIKSMGLNTVIVQVRSHGDAYYQSTLYPTSKYVHGEYGTTLTFDPLKIMVDVAHFMDLSIHAWVNPYRLTTTEAITSLSDDYKIKQWFENPEYMLQGADELWYLNPANDEVSKLISAGVSEIINNYSVDGIHIDDYFYTIPPESFGHDTVKAQESTTKMVKSIYDTIKATKPEILFGISPAGGFTNVPSSDNTQHTNIQLWCKEKGYIDYIVPQIYWEYEHEVAPFTPVLEKWESLLKDSHVKLYIGLASYKFAGTDLLTKQVNQVEESTISKGYIHFRYDNIKVE